VQESPYQAGVPYALACSTSGHSMFHQNVVKALLPGGVLAQASLGALCLVVEQLKPTSIGHALQTMTTNGQMRLNAFSTIALLKKHGTFDGLVRELADIAMSTNITKRFALNCLIAMRGQGWILLPVKAVQKVGHFQKGMQLRGNDWTQPPLAYLEKPQLELLKSLQVNGLKNGTEIANSEVKARFAVLCSTLASVEEVTWPFAERLLFSSGKKSRKGANSISSPAIRAHWRALCEANGPLGMVSLSESDHKSRLMSWCPTDSRLDEWLELLAKHCTYHTGGNFEPVYQAYGHWLTWLNQLDQIPPPLAVDRLQYINNPNPKVNTFRAYLQQHNYQEHTA
jgi:hypothetical protein